MSEKCIKDLIDYCNSINRLCDKCKHNAPVFCMRCRIPDKKLVVKKVKKIIGEYYTVADTGFWNEQGEYVENVEVVRRDEIE